MVKVYAFILLCFCLHPGCSAAATAIDSIAIGERSADSLALTDFISRIDSYHLRYFSPLTAQAFRNMNGPARQALPDSLGVRTIGKGDFDQNGRSDLLLLGKRDEHFSVVVVMDHGQERYQVLPLTIDAFQQLTYPVIRLRQGAAEILYYHQRVDSTRRSTYLSLDTLVYFQDGFVSKNCHPRRHRIESIVLETGGCFGECPVYRISIPASGPAQYVAERHNVDSLGHEVSGTFKAVISSQDLEGIRTLLCYIAFPRLHDNYNVDWTDDQTATLTIVYDGGNIKRIRDYGMIGTHGLALLYRRLSDLRLTQSWTRP